MIVVESKQGSVWGCQLTIHRNLKRGKTESQNSTFSLYNSHSSGKEKPWKITERECVREKLFNGEGIEKHVLSLTMSSDEKKDKNAESVGMVLLQIFLRGHDLFLHISGKKQTSQRSRHENNLQNYYLLSSHQTWHKYFIVAVHHLQMVATWSNHQRINFSNNNLHKILKGNLAHQQPHKICPELAHLLWVHFYQQSVNPTATCTLRPPTRDGSCNPSHKLHSPNHSLVEGSALEWRVPPFQGRGAEEKS